MSDYSHLKVYPSFEDAKAAYFKALDRHYEEVQKGFEEFGKEFCDALNADYNRLAELVKIHDKSKYEVEVEVEGFLANHFPYENDEIGDSYGLRRAKYEKALLSHFQNNPHHPEHWIEINYETYTFEAKPMEPVYVCEMALDWIGYKQSFGVKSISKYWEFTRVTKYLHEDTIRMAEKLLAIIKEHGKD